jgi:hypothetical protein
MLAEPSPESPAKVPGAVFVKRLPRQGVHCCIPSEPV